MDVAAAEPQDVEPLASEQRNEGDHRRLGYKQSISSSPSLVYAADQFHSAGCDSAHSSSTISSSDSMAQVNSAALAIDNREPMCLETVQVAEEQAQSSSFIIVPTSSQACHAFQGDEDRQTTVSIGNALGLEGDTHSDGLLPREFLTCEPTTELRAPLDGNGSGGGGDIDDGERERRANAPVSVEELVAAAAVAVAAKAQQQQHNLDLNATADSVEPNVDVVYQDDELAAAVAEVRLERSNSCSQAEGGGDRELARLSASFVARKCPIGAAAAAAYDAPVSSITQASVSHDNLAIAAAVAQSAVGPTNTSSSSVAEVPEGTRSANCQQRQQQPIPLAQYSVEGSIGAQASGKQVLAPAPTSSSRFFTSKLNTGSLWSLLSVGSTASTSTLNEMSSPASVKQEKGASEQQQQQAESSSSTSSSMTNFFTRQLQFAAKSFDHSHPTSGASASVRQQTAAEQHDKLRLKYRFNVKYIGSAMLHKNFTMPMLEWVVKDIKRQTNRSLNQRQFTIPIRDIVFEIQANKLTAISCKDGNLIFVHPMHCVSKYAQLQHDSSCFSYIIRDHKESPSFCHLFQAKCSEKVHEIFNAIREVAARGQQVSASRLAAGEQLAGTNRLQKSASTEGHWKSLLGGGDSTVMARSPPLQQKSLLTPAAASRNYPSLTQALPIEPVLSPAAAPPPPPTSASSAQSFENSYQFEVMFVKRVKLQCRRVPPTFVDDALETLKTFEAPKTQIKGVTKRIISASVDERQEYDENCQSPTPQIATSSAGPSVKKSAQDSGEERRGSSASLKQQSDSSKSGLGPDEDRESKSCQQSPTKLSEQQSAAGESSAAAAAAAATRGGDIKKHQSVDCLKSIDYALVKSTPPPTYFNDFSPYNTITSSDLNERIAAIPVVSSSVSLDHETRQKLARQVRETIMATAATIKKDVCASGDKLDAPGGSSKVLDSLSCNVQSEVPPIDREALVGDQDPCGRDVFGAARACEYAAFDQAAAKSVHDGIELRRASASANMKIQRNSQGQPLVSSNNFDLLRRTSARQVVKNKTILLLIGQDELCAISIDKHEMLFSKSFNSIVHCLQGISNKDHFGLICRDSNKINPQAESYAGFVFKCQSDKVVREIMGALKQVIYSSQYNYHGLNSPYNPLNAINQQQHGTSSAASKQSQRSPKLGGCPQQVGASASSSTRQRADDQQPEQTLSLASKRGFGATPLELDEARRLQQSGSGSRQGPPPSAPALNAYSSALAAGAPPAKNPVKSMFCDDCPLYWFHRLCCDIESLPTDASKAIILRRIDSSLSEREQDEVYSKFSEFNIESVEEHNEIFMSILRQLCERKQHKHGASQAHLNAMAKSKTLARQQSSELLKQQKQQQQAHSLLEAASQSHQEASKGFNRSAGHQRSGSSGGSLAAVIGQTHGNSQSLADASSVAIDNLKRAKNSISVSIENMLKRRASFKDEPTDSDDELLQVNAGSSLARSGSFKGTGRDYQRASGHEEQQGHGGAAASNLLKRSQSTSDYPHASSRVPAASWRDSLSRTLNDDLTNPLVGFFKRRDSFVTSSDQSAVAESDSKLGSKRASTDSLAAGHNSGAAPAHSPSRQTLEQQPQPSRWIQPTRIVSGAVSPSSLLSGTFWKKSIFDKIHQPNDEASQLTATSGGIQVEVSALDARQAEAAGKRTREELRALWKKAILEQITLLKMDKQNQKLQANSFEYNIQRMKLNYRDVPYGKDSLALWDRLLRQAPTKKVQFVEVARLVRLGVPKQRRGEVWMFLMHQYQLRHGTSFQPPQDSEFRGDADQTYRSLLSQLSTQQHEIFVDIGRTFPSHPYYSQYLSIGQLSLFNLLKAYSLLDKEVGYCQGLSFVAGILLLHVESEDEAFELMRHLLFNFGLRKQYLPSMNALHLQLYQLTRLLRDHLYEIFDQFDRLDISPSLYAAPWFLTLFASQFPLGFVARLLDLIYLIGIEAIFRVSLTLLTYHREALLRCTSLEVAMEFMRCDLVKIDEKNLAKIFDEAISLDLRNKLIEYEIEYSFYCAEDKARASSGVHHSQHHPHHLHNHYHHALASSRQSANSSSSTVYSDIRRDTNATGEALEDEEQLAGGDRLSEQTVATGLTSEVADATATVIIQHLLANNHLRSLRSNYSY